jgi:hypothetical protein
MLPGVFGPTIFEHQAFWTKTGFLNLGPRNHEKARSRGLFFFAESLAVTIRLPRRH